MTKKEYLRLLEKKLGAFLPDRQVEIVVEEYADMFEQEIGRSEEEICQMLGTPQSVCQKMRERHCDECISHTKKMYIMRVVAVIIIALGLLVWHRLSSPGGFSSDSTRLNLSYSLIMGVGVAMLFWSFGVRYYKLKARLLLSTFPIVFSVLRFLIEDLYIIQLITGSGSDVGSWLIIYVVNLLLLGVVHSAILFVVLTLITYMQFHRKAGV